MKRLLIVAALSLITTFAYADATITISLTGAGANNTTRSFIVSDANGARYLAWARTAYPINPNGSPTTNKQAIEYAFEAILRGLRDNVVGHDKNTAAKSASDAIAPINQQ